MIAEYIKQDTTRLAHEGLQYLEFFRLLDENLAPSSYFEIGTNQGRSLQAFRCDALCIDPQFIIEVPVFEGRRKAFFFQMTSDQFFRENKVRDYFPSGPDVCFLDGMHKFEFLLRDFINTEATCRNNSLIFLHDCLPQNARMAERVMRVDESEDVSTRSAWTGDVWRILPTLKKYRPEMRVLFLDCGPTGLVACTSLNPTSDVLATHYNSIVDEMMNLPFDGIGLQQIWGMYPTISTRLLGDRPADISAIFNVY